MKCEEVQAKLLDLEAGNLSEIERRYMLHHLKGCLDCAEEHQVIKRSMEWMEGACERPEVDDEPLMDDVMERIRQENKWAVPMPKRKFHLSDQLRRIGSLLAVILLVTLSLSFMIITVQDSRMADIDTGWVQLSWTDPQDVASDDPSSLASEENSVVASISDPIVFVIDQHSSPINYWIVGTLLGTAVIVLGMCWLTRIG